MNYSMNPKDMISAGKQLLPFVIVAVAAGGIIYVITIILAGLGLELGGASGFGSENETAVTNAKTTMESQASNSDGWMGLAVIVVVGGLGLYMVKDYF